MLPLYVAVSGKRIVVFGGGSVAERKIRQILETCTDSTEGNANINIEVYSLAFTPWLDERCEDKTLHCFHCDLLDQSISALLKDAFLILICTSDVTLNEHLFTEATKTDALINYADKGNVFMSSVVKKGGMLISDPAGDRERTNAQAAEGMDNRECHTWGGFGYCRVLLPSPGGSLVRRIQRSHSAGYNGSSF